MEWQILPLIGELPNIYINAVNNPSKSILAKRHGYGSLVSYNVPPYGWAGLYLEELVTLNELVSQWVSFGKQHREGDFWCWKDWTMGTDLELVLRECPGNNVPLQTDQTIKPVSWIVLIYHRTSCQKSLIHRWENWVHILLNFKIDYSWVVFTHWEPAHQMKNLHLTYRHILRIGLQ